VAALWEWVQTSSGDHDIAAWQRLLANLPFQDPRRSLAASRLANLRTTVPHDAGDATSPGLGT
jgi:cytochrome c-type biogenesis protein CcmH/NrfG